MMADVSGDNEALIEAAFAEYARDAYRRSPVDRRVAVHESSHCVVGWLVGEVLVEVAIHDDGSGVADSTVETPAHLRGVDPAIIQAELVRDHPGVLRAACAKHIVSVLAGLAADERSGRTDWWCSRDDLAQADRLASLVEPRRTRDTFLAELRAITRMAVSDAAPLIEGLADLLQDQRRLPGSVVEAWLEAQPLNAALKGYYCRLFEVAE